jgi:hypothetical protein
LTNLSRISGLDTRRNLIGKLMERGFSRRHSVRILNLIFREMGLALRRGEYVEFPFGYLKAEKGRRWEAIGDEPMRPYFIEHYVDDEGRKLLDGDTPLPWAPGWSRKVDKRSFVYLWDRALRREEKQARKASRRHIGRQPLELDRAAILRDRQHGRSLGQLAKIYRVSRTTIHRVLQEQAAAVTKGVENIAS